MGRSVWKFRLSEVFSFELIFPLSCSPSFMFKKQRRAKRILNLTSIKIVFEVKKQTDVIIK